MPLNPAHALSESHGVIKSSWISEFPSRRTDAKFWILVTKAMEELGIDPATAEGPEVKQAFAHVKAKMEKTYAKIADLRAKAEKLRAQARKEEEAMPDVQWLKMDEALNPVHAKLRVPNIGDSVFLTDKLTVPYKVAGYAIKVGNEYQPCSKEVAEYVTSWECTAAIPISNIKKIYPPVKKSTHTYAHAFNKINEESTHQGGVEWFRWLHGTANFNIDMAREMLETGYCKGQKHSVKVADCYQLLGLDKEEFGSKDFQNDWEAGRGINIMSAVMKRSTMGDIPSDKMEEPALVAMIDSDDLMKRCGLKLKHKPLGKAYPVLIDGNHRLGRLFLEGVESAVVWVVPYEEVLKFTFDRNYRPVLKQQKPKSV